MAVKVRIPDALRKLTNGQDMVTLEATTVRNMIDALETAHPGIKERICDEQGNVRRFVNVFVNEEDIRFQENLETPLPAGTEISILPAVAGGSGTATQITRRVYLNFNTEACTKPIIYDVIKKFDVIPNIRTASVTEDIGIMGVEFKGTQEEVEKALDWIRKQGVKVDPIEMNVVES